MTAVPETAPSDAPAPDAPAPVAPNLEQLLLRFVAQEFLEHEAALLDHNHFHDWLDLMAPDVVYQVPIRVTRRQGRPNLVREMFHIEDDLRSLTLRVRRLDTDVAWAEDPPSRTRRFVTNVRAERTGEGELSVTSYLLLYRSRGDDGSHDLLSAERSDVLRLIDGVWHLARREVVLDQSTLGTKNLGIFL